MASLVGERAGGHGRGCVMSGGHVTLLGAEDVARAASRMGSAADDMLRAASSIDSSVDRLCRSLDEAAQRMQDAAERIERAMAVGTSNGATL